MNLTATNFLLKKQQDVITLQKENKTLSLQRDFALSELKKAAELKKILEESLYAKVFTVVLVI
jgi:hypothetical protein